MLFKREFHKGLRSGAITLTFRRWSGPRVKVGGRYRVGGGLVEVNAIDQVRVAAVTPAEARRSGFPDRDALLAALARGGERPLRDRDRVFRVALRWAGADDRPRPAVDANLSPADTSALAERLARMDRLSRHGAWTAQTLDLIARHPRTAAARLAREVGRETQPFKVDVRKLKKLGLTLSHDVGYELSPRGHAFLERR